MHCEYGGQAVLVAEDNNARRNSDLAEKEMRRDRQIGLLSTGASKWMRTVSLGPQRVEFGCLKYRARLSGRARHALETVKPSRGSNAGCCFEEGSGGGSQDCLPKEFGAASRNLATQRPCYAAHLELKER